MQNKTNIYSVVNRLSLNAGDECMLMNPVSAERAADVFAFASKFLIFETHQDVCVMVADSVLHESSSVKKAIRIWVICMPNMMFIADYVRSKEPLRLETSFVTNNGDNQMNTNVYNAHRLVFRRGAQAMKLFNAMNLADGKSEETELIYDSMNYRWISNKEGQEHFRLHALMMDEEEKIKFWHLREADDFFRLEAPDHINTLDFKFTKDGFAVRRKCMTKSWSIKQRKM